MSIRKSGKRFYCSFQLNGERYNRACKGCTTERQAIKFEKELKEKLKHANAHHDQIKFHRQEIKKLSTNADIQLSKAFELARSKPTSRTPSRKQVALKKRFWDDFVAFCANKKINLLQDVTPTIAEEYTAYIRNNGRYIVNVEYTDKNGKHVEYSVEKRKLAPSTTNKMVQTCAWIFNVLSYDGGITHNPFNNIPIMANNYESRDIFTDDEIRKIIESKDDFAAPMCRMALFTGLREGDICSLRWDNIIWEDNFIRKKMNKTNTIVEIPIIERQFLEDLYTNRTSDEFIFPEQYRIYSTSQDGIPYRISKFLTELGIEKNRVSDARSRKISVKDFHSLRHTFAVKCAEQDIPIHVVQQVLGHSNPKITEIYTAHYNRKFTQKAMRRFQLLDDNDKAPVIFRLLFSLKHFHELLESDQQKFVMTLFNTLSSQQIEEYISVVRQHMAKSQKEIELSKQLDDARKQREFQEYARWYENAISSENEEQKAISDLSMAAEEN